MRNKLTLPFKDLVDYYLSVGILHLDDVISASEEEIMNKILKQVHPFAIFYSEKNCRWCTTIEDNTKSSGRRQIVRKKRGDLEKFLLEHYKIQMNTFVTQQKTFGEIFQLVQENKVKYIKNEEKLISASNTTERDYREYKRYFSGSEFENKPIDTITKADIEDICLYNLERYDLKEKAFKYLRGILKWVFDFAYSEYWITDNVLKRVDFKRYKNMISESISPEERVHSEKEVSDILQALHRKQAEQPKLCSAWALELQILMGTRRGEIPPLTLLFSKLYDASLVTLFSPQF